MSELVHYSVKEGVATISIDDGKVNVMSTAMLDAIDKALDQADRDGAIVSLRSACPGLFSAGFDLKIFAANDAEKSLEMVKAGGELALRLLSFPQPTIGIMQGHAFPMGTFLLLACDVRVASRGPHRMGLNEVAIGISPPSFAIELARSRMHPAWLSRTVTVGEMFEPEEALTAGLLDLVVEESELDSKLEAIVTGLSAVHRPSHTTAKRRLRTPTMTAMREAIDREMTIEAYTSSSRTPSAVVLPGSN